MDEGLRTLEREALAGAPEAQVRFVAQLERSADPRLLAAAALRDQIRRMIFGAARDHPELPFSFVAVAACLEEGLSEPLTPTTTFSFVKLSAPALKSGVGLLVYCPDQERVRIGAGAGKGPKLTPGKVWSDLSPWSGSATTREAKLRKLRRSRRGPISLRSKRSLIEVPRSTVEDLLRFEAWAPAPTYDLWRRLTPDDLREGGLGRGGGQMRARRARFESLREELGWSPEQAGGLLWELGGYSSIEGAHNNHLQAAIGAMQLESKPPIPARVREHLEALAADAGLDASALRRLIAKQVGCPDLRSATAQQLTNLRTTLSKAGGGPRLASVSLVRQLESLQREEPELIQIALARLSRASPEDPFLPGLPQAIGEEVWICVRERLAGEFSEGEWQDELDSVRETLIEEGYLRPEVG